MYISVICMQELDAFYVNITILLKKSSSDLCRIHNDQNEGYQAVSF